MKRYIAIALFLMISFFAGQTHAVTPQKITVKLSATGGSGGSTSVRAVVGKAMPAIRVPKRDGFVFCGYYSMPDGSGKLYYKATGNSARKCDLAAGTKLYAKWAASRYRIAFYPNGGSGKMAVERMIYGNAKKLTGNAFSRTGFYFAGWAKSQELADAGQVAYKNYKKVKNLVTTGETIRLYAVWKEYLPKTPGKIRFALCQIPTGKYPASTRADKTFAWVESRLTGEEDVIVFPEFTFVTFKEESGGWRKEASIWKKAAAFARKRNAFVLVNTPSRDEGNNHVYSETRVFSPRGGITAVYRKRVLANMDIKAGFTPGPRAVMAKLPFTKLGILICKDAFSPKKGFAPYTKADILLAQFAHPGASNQKSSVAKAGFKTPAKEMSRLRNTRTAWTQLGKPYMAVNKTGQEGNYTLAGGTFAAKASGKIVTKLDADVGVLFVDFSLGDNERIDPSTISVP